ncbi:hypothetical protein DFH08DRAFT_950054 [Mycena albidolilacea]|uniref:Uncharacterized protein n=1 Tax=Mycena albidolilacea TaxID=1033008 RepID=A0AAD7F298_9AGAR|nr:hypothetical protein DFH08DRAFT_950054 [Mycena albidolilacea]
MLHDVDKSMSTAEDLSTWCSTTPGMNTFQSIAAAVVEVCRAANLVGTKNAQIIAAIVVDETKKVINRMAFLPPSPDNVQKLAPFQKQLEEIRRCIEEMPTRSKSKVLMSHIFDLETHRLKSELKRISKVLLDSIVRISEGECIMEVLSLSIDAVGAVCDAPVLNALKPILSIVAMICDRAKSMKSNHEAVLELAKHSRLVAKSIINHAATQDISTAGHVEALAALESALEDIRVYLTALQKPRHCLMSWIMVNYEKDRTVQLNRALDEALALFTSATAVSTHAEVTMLVHLHRESIRDVTQMLTSMHADLAMVAAIVQDRDNWGFRVTFRFPAPPRLLLASMSYLHGILISVTAPHPAVLSSCLHHVPARVRVRTRSPRLLCTRRRASGVLATRPLARRRWRSSFSASPLVFSPPVCPPSPSRRSLPVPHRVGSRALAVLGFTRHPCALGAFPLYSRA